MSWLTAVLLVRLSCALAATAWAFACASTVGARVNPPVVAERRIEIAFVAVIALADTGAVAMCNVRHAGFTASAR